MGKLSGKPVTPLYLKSSMDSESSNCYILMQYLRNLTSLHQQICTIIVKVQTIQVPEFTHKILTKFMALSYAQKGTSKISSKTFQC